jgi:hypothetical protein
VHILESRASYFPDGTEGDWGILPKNNASYPEMEPFQRMRSKAIFFLNYSSIGNICILYNKTMQMFLSGEMLLSILVRKDDKVGM